MGKGVILKVIKTENLGQNKNLAVLFVHKEISALVSIFVSLWLYFQRNLSEKAFSVIKRRKK